MKKINLTLNFVEEKALKLYNPVSFLRERHGLFSSVHFNIEDILKLIVLDLQGAIYSDVKFSAAFLKKLDKLNVGYIALKYNFQNEDKLKYALILKSYIKLNPKAILLK